MNFCSLTGWSFKVRELIVSSLYIVTFLLAAGQASAQQISEGRKSEGIGLSPSGDITVPPERLRYPWGSIASGKNDAFGWSFEARTRSEARELAVEACERADGINCEARVSVQGRCAVVVHGPTLVTTGISLNTAGRRAAARQRALDRCGEGCWIVKEICSVRD